RSCVEAAVTASTACSKASSLARDGFVKPLILRTYWSAAARTSSSVAGGSKLKSVWMLRHTGGLHEERSDRNGSDHDADRSHSSAAAAVELDRGRRALDVDGVVRPHVASQRVRAAEQHEVVRVRELAAVAVLRLEHVSPQRHPPERDHVVVDLLACEELGVDTRLEGVDAALAGRVGCSVLGPPVAVRAPERRGAMRAARREARPGLPGRSPDDGVQPVASYAPDPPADDRVAR